MKKIIFFFTLFLAFNLNTFAQIIIKEITSDIPTNISNYSSSESRKIYSLNDNWIFQKQDSEESGVSIKVPSTFSTDEVVVLKRKINFTNYDIARSKFVVHFLGISNSADIFFNDVLINKMSESNIPFNVEIPKDLVSAGEDNFLRIVLSTKLDSRNSIPLSQRFLFPKNSGGIVRDVYLEVLPIENIQLKNYFVQISGNLKSATINISLNKFIKHLETSNHYFVEISYVNEKGNVISKRRKVNSSNNLEIFKVELSNPKLWSIKNPFRYDFEFKLFKDEQIIDIFNKKFAIAQLENSTKGILLNKAKFTFNGVTYIHSDKDHGTLISYSDLKKDLLTIKALGINSVRFSKLTPHPFALDLCEEIGLVPLIEIPLNCPPELIVEGENFIARSEKYFQNFIESYSNYSSTLIVGVGSGYNGGSEVHKTFIKNLAASESRNKKILAYASFTSLPRDRIKGIDLYGIEVYDNISQIDKNIENSNLKKDVFISEATYPNYVGNSNGYLNDFSFEAQAKYFEKIIDKSKSDKLSGFFINSMFDYYGDFSSFYSKYNKDNLYQIGILKGNETATSTSYLTIASKLLKTKRINIPVGSKKDDAPMFFIVAGLILSVLMGVLINSKKKLREDATRALIRPYNFFADIRDHRIISGLGTVFLMLILAGSHSLLVTSILYYLKNNILFEKILLAFGLPSFISLNNYLAWNPNEAFVFFFVISILFFFLISLVIYLSSFFIRIKIYYMSIFFSVVWATLPLALLLPVKMVLYRILLIKEFNTFIYTFLVLYLLWIGKRIITGVYVIFDIGSSRAYLYSIITSLIIIGSFVLYFQIYHSTLYYLFSIFNQIAWM